MICYYDLGEEKVAGPKVWRHTGIPAQGYDNSTEYNEVHNKNSNLEQNQQKVISPNIRYSLSEYIFNLKYFQCFLKKNQSTYTN
ncbi:MAG: hypothetical protein MRJ93_05115 [Nitrososphaeraceae archaeon]|nr:hypothetical protein [Nitrososphaeraceae archaeon]